MAAIDAQQTPIGADPDGAGVVEEEALDGRVDVEAGVDADIFQAEEGVAVAVVDAEAAAEGADPEAMEFIFQDAFYLVVRDGAGVGRVVAIDREGIAVVAVEAVLGAEPHKAIAVAEDAVHAALGEAVAGRKRGEADGFLVLAADAEGQEEGTEC